MRALQTFVELIQLHQHAFVILVKAEGTLHIFHSLILTSLFVESSKC